MYTSLLRKKFYTESFFKFLEGTSTPFCNTLSGEASSLNSMWYFSWLANMLIRGGIFLHTVDFMLSTPPLFSPKKCVFKNCILYDFSKSPYYRAKMVKRLKYPPPLLRAQNDPKGVGVFKANSTVRILSVEFWYFGYTS